MVMHQGKYVEKLLQCFDFEDCKPVSTPVETGFRFSVENSCDALILLFISMLWDVLYMHAIQGRIYNMQFPS